MTQKTDKPDLRIRRSRKLLRDALVALIEEQGYETITVNDLAERAMVNRATFYRHYRDKQDLLERCMDDVFDELVSQLEPPDDQRSDMTIPQHNFLLLVNHIADYADFYRIMFGKNGSGAFVARVRAYLEKVSMARLALLWTAEQKPLLPLEATVSAIVSMHLGLVIWWLEQHQPCNREQLAAYMLLLVVQGPYAALGMAPPA